MSFLFCSRPVQPAAVSSDEVVPLRSWDTALSMRETVLDVSMIFHDVLDVSKLQDALDRLYPMGHWRQLGARLRLNETGNLEYHIPRSYDKARPAFVFTKKHHDMPIASHPLAAKFPGTSSKARLFTSPDDFTPLVRHEATPRKLDDWIYSDHPQLFLHSVSFNDATILTVTFPHTLADVMGIGVFLKAWSAVVRGEQDNVPALESFQSNPLTELGQKTPADKYMFYDRILGKGQILMFVGRRLLDQFWYRQEERRTIFLPAATVHKMRTKAIQRLEESGDHGCLDSKPFLSESDIVLAWLVRTEYFALGLQPSQKIMVNNAFNLRTSMHNSFTSPKSAYVGNAVCMSPTFVRGHHLEEETLGVIAWRIRQSVAQQQAPEQVEAVTALMKETMEKTGYLAFVGEPGMVLLSSSNWHKAGIYGLDFSSAVKVTEGEVSKSDRIAQAGRPAYVNGVLHSKLSFRNTFAVTGRDAQGNWWLNGVLRTEAWRVVERELATLES